MTFIDASVTIFDGTKVTSVVTLWISIVALLIYVMVLGASIMGQVAACLH